MKNECFFLRGRCEGGVQGRGQGFWQPSVAGPPPDSGGRGSEGFERKPAPPKRAAVTTGVGEGEEVLAGLFQAGLGSTRRQVTEAGPGCPMWHGMVGSGPPELASGGVQEANRYAGSLPAPRPVGVPVRGQAGGKSWGWGPVPRPGEDGGWGRAPVQGYGGVQEGGHQLRGVVPG